MRALTRVGSAALGASVVSAALLGSGVGVALAQEADACDVDAYPPKQCEVKGGASAGAPPLVVNRTIGQPGDPVVVAGTGCTPGTTVTLHILRVEKPGGGKRAIGDAIAKEDGTFDISASIPADLANGVYLLYSSCTVDGTPRLRVTSFVIASQPLVPGSARPAGGSSTQQASTSRSADDAAFAAAVAAADMPSEWVAPQGWTESAAVKQALTQAVNLELAALRSALPAADATVASPPAPASPTDTSLWAAGAVGGAVFLLLGAVGWRRHAAKAAITSEVAQ